MKRYFEAHPYPVKVFVLLSLEELEQLLKEEFPDRGDTWIESVIGSEDDEGKAGMIEGIAILYLKNLEDEYLVHECTHIMFDIMNYIENKYSIEGEEAFTYLNQFLFKNIKALISNQK